MVKQTPPSLLEQLQKLKQMSTDIASLRLLMVAQRHNLEATTRERDEAYTVLGWTVKRSTD